MSPGGERRKGEGEVRRGYAMQRTPTRETNQRRLCIEAKTLVQIRIVDEARICEEEEYNLCLGDHKVLAKTMKSEEQKKRR